MGRIRVLLACPNLVKSNVVKAHLAQEQDIDLVGEAVDPVEVLLQVSRTRAEVVIIDLSASGEEPGLVGHLLEEYPRVHVIAVSQRGDRTIAYRRGIIGTEITVESPEGFAKALRDVVSEGDRS